jgi:hypothetical protein
MPEPTPPEDETRRWSAAPPLPEARPVEDRWTPPPANEPEPIRWAPAPPEPEPNGRWKPSIDEDTDEVRWPPIPDNMIEAEPSSWQKQDDTWSKPADSKNPFEDFAYEKKNKKGFDSGATASRAEPEWRTMPPEPRPDPRVLPFQDPDPNPRIIAPDFLTYGDDHQSDIAEKFSSLVTLDQKTALVREPEPPLYEGDSNQATIKLVVALLMVLIAVAGVVVEHRVIEHFLPVSARFFNLLGLK